MKIVGFVLLLASLLIASPASALNGPVLQLYGAQSGQTACITIRPAQTPMLVNSGHDSISAGWTHIVHMPDTNLIFFYNANSGSGAVAFNSGNCVYSTVHSFPAGYFSQGWTSIAPAGGSRLLFYRTDGVTALATISGSGAISTIRSRIMRPNPILVSASGAPFPQNYTSVVKVRSGVFFYNAATGDGEYGTFDTEGWYHRGASMAGLFSPGWTNIVYIPSSDRVLYYNNASGNGALGHIDNTGHHTTIRSFRWETPGFTHIVPTTGTTLLFYNRLSGATTFGSVTDAGFDQTSSSPPVGTGWSSILFGS